MILVGDIGGTRTPLALFGSARNQWLIQFTATYPSKNYASLEKLIQLFLVQARSQQAIPAAVGVSGAIIQTKCELTTNLPWIITVAQLQPQFQTAKVFLINELETMGTDIPHLPSAKLIALNPIAIIQPNNKTLIAAGTDLDEGLLY